jgi:hypothetical protein
MITCNLMGGLGNQIFQIFATISCAINHRMQFKFLNVESLGGGFTTIRYTFWDKFFYKLKPFLIDNINIYPTNVIREKDFTFNKLIIDENQYKEDIMLSGYFQSYKYFQENYQLICRLIGLQQMKDDLLLKVNLNDDLLQNTISMHFRIGDYKKLQHVHPIMTKDYYFRALNYIKSLDSTTNYTVLYFCEDDDIDDVIQTINYLKDKFIDYDFIRGKKELEDWEQMLLMSCCHHNIIANSSFSWWAAYLNSHKNKIVCYPSIWFGPSAPHNTNDLCPLEWFEVNI